MNKKRKASENKETDRSKRSNVEQEAGRQHACAADQVPKAKAAAAKGIDGKASKAADASQQGPDEAEEYDYALGLWARRQQLQSMHD
jgi:hypothetical protein